MFTAHTVSCALMLALSLIIGATAATDPDTHTLNTVHANWGFPVQLASWGVSSGRTACNMTGISCNAQAQVVSLSLYYTPTGTFDPLLFSLTSLSSIALVQVGLIGSIPAQISQLTGLQMLQTSNNLLAGSLPPSLSLLLILAVLDMNSNQLTGPIPPQLSTLTLLSLLQLGDNKLTGVLPVSLSSLHALVNYYAPVNSLTNQIPAQYSALQQLTSLFLSSNLLTGVIPAQLTTIVNLSLSLTHNHAMCGLALSYGAQPGTGIGQDCPGPPRMSDENIIVTGYFSFMGLVIVFLACVGFYHAYCDRRALARAAAARAAAHAAAVVVPPVAQLAVVHPAPVVQVQLQPGPTCNEVSRFFLPD